MNTEEIINTWENNKKIRSINTLVKCGVYILFYKHVVVYVGQSLNVLSRLSEHVNSYKIFDGYDYIVCTPDIVLELEKTLIKKYTPKYNTTHNTTPTRIVNRFRNKIYYDIRSISTVEDAAGMLVKLKRLGQLKEDYLLAEARRLYNNRLTDTTKQIDKEFIKAVKDYIKATINTSIENR
jgi:hypothetical protein